MKRLLRHLGLLLGSLYVVLLLSTTPAQAPERADLSDLPCCQDCPVWCPLCRKCP